MRSAVIVLCLLVGTALAANPPKPSGPLRAYKGPEGELVIMLEVNDSKQMLVQFQKTGGSLDGKTLLYDVDDTGHGDKEVYSKYKRGSKWYRSIVLTKRDGAWQLHMPGTGPGLSLVYSEKASEQYKAEDMVKAYKP